MNHIVSLLAILSTFLIQYGECVGCLDGINHHREPQANLNLTGQCSNWGKLSCCSETTAIQFHLTNQSWYNFNYDHCGLMSDKCRSRFLQELCLYECDPYLDQWIVKDTSKKIRNERFYRVPLCKKDCNTWFDDCRNDYTCATNWNNGFKWIKGANESKNVCQDYAKCDTFERVFGCAENFCQSVWDGSFHVPENESEPCISFTFDSTQNPNVKVDAYYSSLSGNSAVAAPTSFIKYDLILFFSTILLPLFY